MNFVTELYKMFLVLSSEKSWYIKNAKKMHKNGAKRSLIMKHKRESIARVRLEHTTGSFDSYFEGN